jgi:hypothetical protein
MCRDITGSAPGNGRSRARAGHRTPLKSRPNSTREPNTRRWVAPFAGALCENRTCHDCLAGCRRFQQTDYLTEKRQIDTRIGPHHCIAGRDLDRADIRPALRDDRHKIRQRNAATTAARSSRRQEYNWLRCSPCRRAIVLVTAPGAKLSATIAAFSAALHPRRRGVPVSTSTRRKLCPLIGKLLGKLASLPRPTEVGSANRHQAAQDGN